MSSMPSRFRRVNQWLQFSRQWHVIDASQQDAFELGKKVAYHLGGKQKPIWHPETDCGDHVVVINARNVAMHGFDWSHISFHFDRRYPRSKNNIIAHKIHEYDPCRVLFMIISSALKQHVYRNNIPQRWCLERLHLLPDEEIPEIVRKNIDNQLEQVQAVPRKSTEYTKDERAKFPRMFQFKDDHILDWQEPVEIPEWERYEPLESEKRVHAPKMAGKKEKKGKNR